MHLVHVSSTLGMPALVPPRDYGGRRNNERGGGVQCTLVSCAQYTSASRNEFALRERGQRSFAPFSCVQLWLPFVALPSPSNKPRSCSSQIHAEAAILLHLLARFWITKVEAAALYALPLYRPADRPNVIQVDTDRGGGRPVSDRRTTDRPR